MTVQRSPMKKRTATLFLAALAFGSMYGCVVDDSYDRGRPGDHHSGDGGDRGDRRDGGKMIVTIVTATNTDNGDTSNRRVGCGQTGVSPVASHFA